MDQQLPAPKLLLIAGASCSGKTELALALQGALPGLWLVWKADRAQPLFPLVEEHQTIENEGRLTEANLRALRAYLDLGFSTIAEIDLWDDDRLSAAHRTLGHLNPLTIELRCGLAELERRERARGTTSPGFARTQLEEWNLSIPADLVLDSELKNPSELAQEVVSWLKSEPHARGLLSADKHV